jgi:transcriptional regulator with PAS, ATPase and Fis domain
MTMAQLERAAIEATLRHTHEDKNLTAKLLGISLRTLYRRLEED